MPYSNVCNLYAIRRRNGGFQNDYCLRRPSPLKQGTSEKRHSRRDPRPSNCFFKMLHVQLSKDPLFDFVLAPNDADARLAAIGSDYIIVPSGDSDMLLYPTSHHRLILAAH
eukprot:TRINITY_DN12127_c0_g2_i2.p3 TRINITY_DN12127_c0_g2~~TRINITY_DN12127_c0_g2_i2.p3  ORF type:complete len:111 (-),score=1.52 TRINITY_DN12127_c0_g2_i2:658-990(-)